MEMRMPEGAALYVVATPIGNLGDLSPRALEVLKSVDLIAAEDTRVTMKLCSHFDIHTPLVSNHQHNEENAGPRIAERMLAEGLKAALVTDAGTPAISDPGTYLVRACVERGIPVYAVAGPTAMAAAVSVSGFDFHEFTFYGFLPRDRSALEEKLRRMPGATEGAVVHESPFRVKELMAAVVRVLPEARVSLSCDLTKLHELTLRGTPAEVLEALEKNDKSEKGEYCMVLDLRLCKAESEAPKTEASLEGQLLEMCFQGLALREAKESLIAKGYRKNAVYAAAVSVKAFLEGWEG
ncbi:MAG: 16S rRNA (cytidine(1402)-2'-O)-methyltransferase [Clostridia bacterium]|nr:16S rRNA (cytidine(1402)-2'-O)-methyltransferase [Clostridia bacterium]